MNNGWAQQEQVLWDTMVAADRGIRMPNTRTMSPKVRAKVRDRVQKQRNAAFAAGWKALENLIAH